MTSDEILQCAKEFIEADDELTKKARVFPVQGTFGSHPEVEDAWNRVTEATKWAKYITLTVPPNNRLVQLLDEVLIANSAYGQHLQSELKSKKDRDTRRHLKHRAEKAAQKLRRAVQTALSEKNEARV